MKTQRKRTPLPTVKAAGTGTLSLRLAWLGMALLAAGVPDSRAQSCATPPSGLIAWWPADGDGLEVVGGFEATLFNGAAFGAGQVGLGFDLDGVDDRIVVPDAPALNFGSAGDFSIEGWIQAFPQNTSYNVMSILEKRVPTGGAGSAQGYAFYLDAGRLSCQLDPAPGLSYHSFNSPGPNLMDGVFHHVAVTVERLASTGGKLYVDGVVVHTFDPTSAAGDWSSTAEVRIGNHPDLSLNCFFKGMIDDLSLYGRALSSGEIQNIFQAGSAGKCRTATAPQILTQPVDQTVYATATVSFQVLAVGTSPLRYQWMRDDLPLAGATNANYVIGSAQTNDAGAYAVVITNSVGSITSSIALLVVNSTVCATPPSGLISWWKAEGSAVDQVGTNHGTLAGHATYTAGFSGRGFLFDGNGDYVSVGSPAQLKVQDFTIETWIKRSSSSVASFQGGLGMIFAWGQGGYGLYLEAGGKPALSRVGIDNITLGTPVITNTDFHHLAVTKSGSVVVFYVDGVAYPVGAYDPGFTFTTGARIGAWDNPATHSFYGRIDEVAVYDRALAEAEIQELYAAVGLGKCVTPVAPTFLTQPTNQFVNVAANASFSALAHGGPPPLYQWRLNGNPLAGATNSSLVITNVQPSKAGTYSLLISNASGTATSSNAVLKVKVMTATGNGLPLTNATHSFTTNVTIQLQNLFPNGLAFYTLDGSTPTYASPLYTGPFLVTHSATLRALAYSADFFEAGELDPVSILIPPAYSLTLTSGGGGTLTANPAAGPHLADTLVTLTAVPSAGWTFLRWLGDASGSSPVTNVTMTRNKAVKAIFGTSLGVTAAGGGSVQLNPPGGFYPYGTVVQLSAVPNAGNFFALWGNAGSGNVNPLVFTVTNANRTVSSLFAAVGSGQSALTVIPLGLGSVSVSPRANVYTTGSAVAIAATPEAGQAFLGWSGDANGALNPLPIVVNTNQLIYANFTRQPQLQLLPPTTRIATEGVRLGVSGGVGDRLQVDVSTNLLDWVVLFTFTNNAGLLNYTDLAATNEPQRFYRALVP